MQGERDCRKGKQRNKCRKNNDRFKILKIKIKKKENRKKKKENSPELQNLNIEAEVFNNNEKCDWERKEKLKILIRFHSANKIVNYNRGGKKEKRKKKKSKRIYRTSQNIRIINIFLRSLLSESFLSLGVTIHLIPPSDAL